jgi:hypothetical protein
MPDESEKLLMAVFTDQDDVLEATKACREAGFTFYDVYSPYAVHGLDRAMGLPFSKITWVTFICGILGTTIATAGMWYISAWDWPINIGGKAPFPFPAMVPIMFELTVLIGGLCTMLALFAVCRLFPGRKARLLHLRQTDDRFLIVLRQDEDYNEAKAREIFTANNAEEIKEIDEEYDAELAQEGAA